MKEITLIPGVCADQARIKIRFDSKKDKFKKLMKKERGQVSTFDITLSKC